MEKAAEIRSEYDQQLAEYTAAMTAKHLMPGLRSVLQAIARAMRG